MDAGSFLRTLGGTLKESLKLSNVVSYILASLVCTYAINTARNRIKDPVRAWQIGVMCGAIGIALTFWLVKSWSNLGQ